MQAVVYEQFEDAEQQEDSYHAGMWIFLASEIMFFGGMICAYIIYRNLYPAAFEESSHQMDVMLGTINTAVLLTSSLTMAIAVHRPQRSAGWLWATCILGVVFLCIKFFEYHQKFVEHLVPGYSFHLGRPEELFFILYFCMTGLHAIHLTLGCVAVGTLGFMARKPLGTGGVLSVTLVGLYWHFVDLVWIFLYPMLYLIGHHQ